jgi:hypothetical protein
MDGRKDGRTDGRMDGWMDGCTRVHHIYAYYVFISYSLCVRSSNLGAHVELFRSSKYTKCVFKQGNKSLWKPDTVTVPILVAAFTQQYLQHESTRYDFCHHYLLITRS